MRSTQKIGIGAAITVASVLAVTQPVLGANEKTQTLGSILNDKWEKMQQSYVEFRWSYLPGFRLSNTRASQLLDAAVAHAIADPWFFHPHEKIVLRESSPDHEYVPRPDLNLMLKEPPGEERFDTVSIWRENPPKAMDSVRVDVERSFRGKSESCKWRIRMCCSWSWGSWECETETRGARVSTTIGTRRGRDWENLAGSTDAEEILALASDLVAQDIPISILRYLNDVGSDTFRDRWRLGLRDDSRIEEAKAVIARAEETAGIDSVDDRWKDPVPGYGFAIEDVCHPPVQEEHAAAHSTRR